MKLPVYCLLFTVGCLIFPAISSAHVLKTDGSIGAVIHIDPEDDPIAGQPAKFYFDFKDVQKNFTSEQCTCLAQITQNGAILFTQNLFDQNKTADFSKPSFVYTFPKKGLYTLFIRAKPKKLDIFQPFTLTYDIDIDSEAASEPPQPDIPTNHFFHYLILGIPFLYGLVLYVIELRKER